MFKSLKIWSPISYKKVIEHSVDTLTVFPWVNMKGTKVTKHPILQQRFHLYAAITTTLPSLTIWSSFIYDFLSANSCFLFNINSFEYFVLLKQRRCSQKLLAQREESLNNFATTTLSNQKNVVVYFRVWISTL